MSIHTAASQAAHSDSTNKWALVILRKTRRSPRTSMARLSACLNLREPEAVHPLSFKVNLVVRQLSFAWDKPETMWHGRLDADGPPETRKVLWRTKTLRRDPETQEFIQPSKPSVLAGELRKPFTHAYSEDAVEDADDEILVDGKLLSYAYLEAGMIEMLGA
ncbi:hypothetical protein DFH09DRAFT_1082411 [Mycena vulgaris]|nr:hypothetical protein DFH09DRAFT_1082411 [Mycena vulgaris]